MKKINKLRAKNAAELAEILGLTPEDAIEWEIRSELTGKIIDIVKKNRLTHVQVAKLAGTSRSRITAILNRNLHEVSTDLLLRILSRLGYRAKISFLKAA